MTENTPSKKILKNDYDGKIIEDKSGRKLRLKKPDILDTYDLMSAIGEDSKNAVCSGMAIRTLYVATIDDQVIQSPKSLAEFRINLKRIGEDGMMALGDYMDSLESKSDKEEMEKVKKS